MAVKHIALFSFRDSVKPDELANTLALIGSLPRLVPGILSYEAGSYSSPEGLNQGLTHGFIMTFKDAATRDAYLVHPEHERIKSLVVLLLSNVVVFDFET